MTIRISKIALLMVMSMVACAYAPIAVAQEAGPGEGLVVFSREDKFAGSAIRFNINVNGQRSLQLLSGSTIRVPLPAGTHEFSVYTPSLDGRDFITVDVQEGWTYHIEGYTRLGWPTGRPKFRFVSESGPEPGSAPATTQQSAEAGPAEPLAGPALGAVTAADEAPTRTAEEGGRIGLRNFAGDWNLEMWSLATDGSKLEGQGMAAAVAEGDDAVRITFTEFSAPAFPAATGGGQVRIAYEKGRGFMLESWFKHSNEVLNMSGQYEATTGRYVFYMFGSSGELATGLPRASVRVEIRSESIATWVADTYASVEGQSTQVQSYRFTRR